MNQQNTPRIEFQPVILDGRADAQIALAIAYPTEYSPTPEDRIGLSKRLKEFKMNSELSDAEGWWLSRNALLAALEKTGQPFRSFSLSHTGGIGIAVVSNCPGIGVDVERKGRICSERLSKRIRNQVEAATTDMQAWCLLEAVYKADDQQQKNGIFAYSLTQIGENFSVAERPNLKAKLIPHETYVVAVCARN